MNRRGACPPILHNITQTGVHETFEKQQYLKSPQLAPGIL